MPNRGLVPQEGRRATIRALFLEPIVNALIRQGAPIDDMLTRHGFSRADLKSPYSRVSLCLYIEFMEDAAVATGNPFFGLDLGSNFQLQQLGPFYALLSSADNLRAALDIFARFQTAWQTRTSLVVVSDKDNTSYAYTIEDAAIWPRHQDAEFTLGAMATLIRQLGMPRWSPVQVEFEHVMETRGARLREFFKAPVHGNAQVNRITISNEVLDKPFHHGRDRTGAEAISNVERHLRDLLFAEPDDGMTISEATTNCVAKRLGRAAVEIDIIARELNLSSRSLRRKLDEEETSFREILQEQRLLKAETLLRDGRLQISELAACLGYSDVAVFSRAFKTWTGSSPKDYANNQAIRRS